MATTGTKRRALSLDSKVDMVKAIESGLRHGEVCRKFDVKPSTLSTILKKRAEIMKMYENSKIEPSRKRFRFSAVDDVEQALLKWFSNARCMNIPISGPILQAKAEDLAKKMNHADFKASNRWLERFKSRHGITFKSVCGEAASVSEDTVTTWVKTTLPKLIEGYAPRDIFNADETGLYYKLMPGKTLSFKNVICSGGKKSKDQVTVMLCANMDGSEKLTPLVIGKSKKPRCFKNVTSLPVDYQANRKAWMDSDLFQQWLHQVDQKFTREKRKVLLFVDNCPAHPAVKTLKSTKVIFLPPNTTSKLQPMDQGVIRSLKTYYRKRVVEKMLLSIDSGEGLPAINVKDAIDMVHSAWLKVKDTKIANCFRKAEFVHTSPNTTISNNGIDTRTTETEEEVIDDEVGCLWESLSRCLDLSELSFSDFVSADDDVYSWETPSDDNIVTSVLEHRKEDIDSDEEDSENIDPSATHEDKIPST